MFYQCSSFVLNVSRPKLIFHVCCSFQTHRCILTCNACYCQMKGMTLNGAKWRLLLYSTIFHHLLLCFAMIYCMFLCVSYFLLCFCYLLLCFVMFCYVFAMFCYVLLCCSYVLLGFCYVLLCFAMCCYVFAMFCHVLLCFCYFVLCFAMFCYVLLCFVRFLHFLSYPGSPRRFSPTARPVEHSKT